MKTELISKAASILAGARNAVALTGAGISVESGIPPFRGKGGLWEKIDPMTYAHVEAFERHPRQVWEVLFLGLKEVVEKARPNDGHRALRRLEQLGLLKTVITQNIDGLHQMAGSSDVIEFHGTFSSMRCNSCSRRLAVADADLSVIPPKCACGGYLRPDVVLFGEIIDFECLQRAQILASGCDVMLVVGTSATVEPAAYLPVIAKRAGAFIIEVNPERTPLSDRISDATLLGPAGTVMSQLVEQVTAINDSRI